MIDGYVKIVDWFGRFGNNVQQISNAIYYCKKHNLALRISGHPMFRDFSISGSSSQIQQVFFFWRELVDVGDDSDTLEFYKTKKQICEKYLLPNFIEYEHVLSKSDYDGLTIHFRGGDMFFFNNVHSSYSPYPFWYIKKVVDNYQRIHIVCEDKSSPILKKTIGYCKAKNKKIKIQSGSLVEDISTLLEAKNLMQTGVGTFLPAVALMSTNLKIYYCTNVIDECHLSYRFLTHSNDIKVNLTEIPEEYNFVGSWANKKEQIDKLMEFIKGGCE